MSWYNLKCSGMYVCFMSDLYLLLEEGMIILWVLYLATQKEVLCMLGNLKWLKIMQVKGSEFR